MSVTTDQTATPVAELWRIVRRRWNGAILGEEVLGLAAAAVAFAVFRDDLRWALIALTLVQSVSLAANLAVAILLRRERRALRVLSWYAAEVETEADRLLDAGDPARARELVLARPPGAGWDAFQDQRLRARLEGAGAPLREGPVDLASAVAALDDGDARAARAALAVLEAQRLSAQGRRWMGALGDADPDLARLLARRRTGRRRVAVGFLVGASVLAVVCAAVWWPPPPPRLF